MNYSEFNKVEKIATPRQKLRVEVSEKNNLDTDCRVKVFWLSSHNLWVWDTFAEPNNYKQYRVKLTNKIRPQLFREIGRVIVQKT
jgi:hypothetical protein